MQGCFAGPERAYAQFEQVVVSLLSFELYFMYKNELLLKAGNSCMIDKGNTVSSLVHKVPVGGGE